jgi:hypothetical protein
MFIPKFLLIFVAIANLGCITLAAPATQRSDGLPAASSRMRKLLESQDRPTSWRDYSALLGDVVDAKARGKITDETWLLDVLSGCSTKPGTGTALTLMQLMRFSVTDLGIQPSDVVRVIAPYTDNEDTVIADTALAMIGYSEAFLSTGTPLAETIEGRPSFPFVADYLRATAKSHPSWKLVRKLYEINPDAALDTVATTIVSENDRASALKDRDELLGYLYSYRIAGSEEQPAQRAKIFQKLDGMSRDPRWPVRAYVAAAMAASPNLLFPEEIIRRLTNDENAAVSAMSHDLIEK